MYYNEQINEHVAGLSFSQKRELYADWQIAVQNGYWSGVSMTADFREWLFDRIEAKLERQAEKSWRDAEEARMDYQQGWRE